MGHCNIRSLLLAVIVITNCITWTASRHHYTHNVHGHRSRHRRQGAGLFLSSSYVIPGGEGGGAWGEWGEVSPCSRTCGGGVASQKRICLEIGPDGQPRCAGGDTKYFSCETQDCPEGSKDFRAEQCSQYDHSSTFKGAKYTWVPYTKGPNPCELNCMPLRERFYYRHQKKVVDGTRCNDESFDVCVNGVCQPVGCDFMLGSSAREDKCRQCRGNGTNCHTAQGILDTQDLRNGYNDLLLIPLGATSIYISEIKPSSNYLAIRATNNTYYLNGEYHIDFPRTIDIAGATWYYERGQNGLPSHDKLRCLGPTNEPLFLSILLQEPNVGIEYEYSVPQALAPPPNQQYNWVHEEFTPCSATCGGGFQTRNVTCRSREELEIVDESLCNDAFRPVTNQSCNTNPCAATWVEGPWGPCSKHCGEGGSRSREVHCEKIITNGYPSVVADKECFDLLGPKPPLFEKCNENATCPVWFTGPWKPCDKLCDEGKKTRQVVCYQKNEGKIEVLDDAQCQDKKPATEEACIIHPCDGVDWMLTDWVGCDTCLATVRSRSAVCATKEYKIVNDSLCAYHPVPVLEEACDKTALPACEVQWYATQWSKCSAECGKGVQTRKVFCGLFDGASILKVEDSKCNAETRYNDTKPCEIVKCPNKWYAGPWSECSVKCGGGEQYRRVTCLNGGEAAKCDPDTVLDSTQVCNTGACDEDETLPLNPSSTPIMDDYDECEEDEDYGEIGAEADASLMTTALDEMFSDSPSTGYSELESEFTTDTGSGLESLFTEGSGFGSTDSTFSSEEDYTTDTADTGSGESTISTDESTESLATEPTVVKDTSSTDLASPKSSNSTVEGSSTEASKITESTESSADSSSGSTVSGPSIDTSATDETTVSSPTGSTESGATDSSRASGETTVSGATESSVSSATGSSVSEETGSTESTPSSESTEADYTEETEITETDYTEETGSTPTDETSESSSTDETTESSTEDSTLSTSSESESTDDTTESGSTESSSSSDISDKTSETGSTEAIATDSSGTTEAGSTDSSGSTEGGSTEASISTDAGSTGGSTETTVSGFTDVSGATDSTTGSSGSTEAGATEVTESTVSESTEVSGSTEPTETGSTESGSTDVSGSTETTESGSTDISGSTETTESSSTESSGLTESTESGSTTESLTGSTDESTTEGGSTESADTASTVPGSELTGSTESESTAETTEGVTGQSTPYDWTTLITKKGKCKPRASKCSKTKFGCCPDKRTPAAGPFDEGCPSPKTCGETPFGCCPDGVSPALGLKNKGCPLEKCAETLFGCCKSDNKTPAEGNDQEGCPPPPPACKSSKHGCCKDEKTQATGPNKEGCPETQKAKTEPTEAGEALTTTIVPEGAECNATEFGCCPDGVSPAAGPHMEGCMMSCNSSAYGCCPDGETPAHGYDNEGCCLLTVFGCCPDNVKPADGPHLEGCGCQHSRFGCCPDGVAIASGPGNEGCGCQYTDHGCCPDRHTPASGPDNAGCGCHTYQFGCCDDGVTKAQGPGRQGCYCQQSEFGCCGDDKTPAVGPDQAGCDCSTSKYGCCPDGETPAKGTKFLGCTDKPENRQAACALTTDRGPCSNYSVYWFYDMQYGGCSRFWYGGCDGNGNRFTSKEECEDVCVSPPPKDSCNLPMVKGACTGYHPRWFYDAEREHCSQFIYGGCLGNANNFDTRELCQQRCEPAKSEEQCSLPIERGSCAGSFLRWGWNGDSGRCEQFIWGGCEGNTNRFGSEAACLHRCDPPGVPKLKEMCVLEADTGGCADYTEKWYYDTSIKRCRQFYYGGCGGNENRFSTELECENQCSELRTTTLAPTTPPQGDVCSLPSSTGDCDRYVAKWFFDSSISSCRQFYYGGCGGNGNRFESSAECEQRCALGVEPATRPPPRTESRVQTNEQEVCFMSVEAGPCAEARARWAYDAALGVCAQFAYGGCDGNQNNFPTQENCEEVCGNVQDVCQLPMIAGSCDESEMQWFYDRSSDSCSQFTYSGCGGNGNRFASQAECERRCRGAPAPSGTTLAANFTTTPAPGEELPPACRIAPEANEECVGDEGDVWYLDPVQHTCVKHTNVASGPACRRTGVHLSEEACERTCGAFRNIEVCRHRVDPGPCSASIPKFYYDEAVGSCVAFTYRGCHGGPNRFSSIEECEDVCKFEKDPCKRTPKALNCHDYLVAWFFDEGRDECYQYGTCDHTDPNRFATQAECEGQCRRSPPRRPEPATPAPAPQPSADESCATPTSFEGCDNATAVYYYDAQLRECVRSRHGDCGHANAYASEEECERRCGAFRGMGNEVLPDCDRSQEECARLRCSFGVQRTRGADGCERCSCVQVEVDCAPLRSECETLKCAYGVRRATAADGCERCTCFEHPCTGKECPSGERCVANPYRDPITGDIGYTSDCHVVNKPGMCPAEPPSLTEDGHCRRECNDDADCVGVGKCCARGCSQQCLEPAAPTSPAPLTTTYAPELPQAPQANPVTEPEVTAAEGGKATLRCLFHGNPPPKITWRRGEITIDGDVGRYRILSDGALEIVSLYRNDSGVYICVAENLHGISQQEIHLQVNDPVETPVGISGEAGAVIVGELGRSLNIRCLAFGHPQPSIYWYRGRTMLPYSSELYEARENVLQIRKLAIETLGEYACQAFNGVGKPAVWAVQVRAYRPDERWAHELLVPREPVAVTPPRARPPPPPAPTPAPEIDVPVYTAAVNTNIPFEQTNQAVGAELSLPCEVDGYPLPEVYWTKDNARLAPDSRTQITDARLTITGLKLEDTGVYGCHARNEYSSHSSTIQITVQGVIIPVHCTDNPFFADCKLIVRSKYCNHQYYSRFCCESCVKAGQLNALEVGTQSDEAWKRKK